MKNSILRSSLVIAAVALSVAVFSTPVYAQFYAGGKGSVFLPNNSEDGLKHFDTGSGMEGFAGYRFIPNFGLEAGAGYYQSKWTEDNFEGSDVDAKVTVSAIPLTFTAKGFVPLGDKARVYAGAGVGVYFAKAKIEASSEVEGVKFVASDSDTNTAFGYHAVLGGEFMVASKIGLQAEAKWFKAEPKFSLGGDESGSSDKVNIGGVMFSFGVLFQM
jgi:opacity protein-like surface antigen